MSSTSSSDTSYDDDITYIKSKRRVRKSISRLITDSEDENKTTEKTSENCRCGDEIISASKQTYSLRRRKSASAINNVTDALKNKKHNVKIKSSKSSIKNKLSSSEDDDSDELEDEEESESSSSSETTERNTTEPFRKRRSSRLKIKGNKKETDNCQQSAPRKSKRQKRRFQKSKEYAKVVVENIFESTPRKSKRLKNSSKNNAYISEDDQSEESGNNTESDSSETMEDCTKITESKSGRLKNADVFCNEIKSDDSDNDFQSTPRKSKRLIKKTQYKESFCLPSLKEYKDNIIENGQIISPLKERSKKVNNFIKERNTYNTERLADISFDGTSSSCSDDFIDDSYLTRRKSNNQKLFTNRKKHTSKTSSQLDSSDSSSSETKIKLRKKKRNKLLSDNESDEEDIKICFDKNNSFDKSTKQLPDRESRKRRYEKDLLEKLNSVRKASTLDERKKLRKEVFSSSSDEEEQPNNIFGLELEDEDLDFIDDGDIQSGNDSDEGKQVNNSFEQKKFNRIKFDCSDKEDVEYLLSTEEKSFFRYIREGDLCNIKKLLIDIPSLVFTQMSNDQTPLHMAAMQGFSEIVNELLDNKAKPHILDSYNMTPLAHTILNKHFECFKILFKKSKKKTIAQHFIDHFNGMNILHFFMIPGPTLRHDFIGELNACIEHLHFVDKDYYYEMFKSADDCCFLPCMYAIQNNWNKTLETLLSLCSSDWLENEKELLKGVTIEGGNIIHFAVMHQYESFASIMKFCLNSSIIYIKNLIHEKDNHGFTPLMYACEMGKDKFVELLLEAKSDVSIKGPENITALHLAAASGNKRTIELLLEHGHQVGCLDEAGWPPILYANFKANEDCVLLLMKSDPKQIFSLGDLLKTENEEQNEKNAKIIWSTLECISFVDSYYSVFNDFIKSHPSILDDYNHGLFMRTWKRILNFENKLEWLHRRFKYQYSPSYVSVRRNNIMGSVMDRHYDFPSIRGLQVSFVNEPGMCLGPKREFLTCLCEEIVSDGKKLFAIGDNHLCCPYPNSFLADVALKKIDEILKEKQNKDTTVCTSSKICYGPSGIKATADMSEKSSNNISEVTDQILVNFAEKEEISEQLAKAHREMEFIGQFVARVILDRETSISLHLAEPFVKQILGIALEHDKELDKFDHVVYNSIKENDMNDQDMPFAVPLLNRWNNNALEEIDLCENIFITNENKGDYLFQLSLFKFETSIRKEVNLFKKGFYKHISYDFISMFNADEFSLLLNGVSRIDVDSWMANTKYNGDLNAKTEIVVWFWNLVKSLKEEEKALLLKFATGSPCLPIGGFKNLVGLGGGICRFTISRGSGLDKLPCAGTCFNAISLSNYSSEKILREKVLIAIRHGSEGFSFN